MTGPGMGTMTHESGADSESSMPVVSVVITVYNGEQFIDAAVNSILIQSFPEFELIVVDDGSEDDTNQKLQKYTDKRLKCINIGRQGRGKALNSGVKAASGKFIAILDADDVALEDRLENQVKYLREHEDVGLIGSRYRVLIDENGLVYGEEDEKCQSTEEVRSALKNGVNPIFHSAVMYRRGIYDAIGGYDEGMPCLLDWDFYVRGSKVTKLANLDVPVSYKRKHSGQYFWGPKRKTVSADALKARSIVLWRTTIILGGPKRKIYDAVRLRIRSLVAR